MKLFIATHKTRKYTADYAGAKEQEIPVDSRELAKDLDKLVEIAYHYRDRTAKDEGTAVCGAGIMIKYFRKRHRTPSNYMLLRAPFQGNVGSYKALKPVLEYIQQYYPALNAYWEDGNMD